MKIAAILVFIGLCAPMQEAKADPAKESKPSVSFHLIENKADNTFRAGLKLENNSKEAYQDWTLHFNFVRPIIKLTGAQLLEDANRNGDFFSVKGQEGSSTLQPGQQVSMEILGKWFLKHETDAPAGFFITFADASGQKKILRLNMESRLDDVRRSAVASENPMVRGRNPDLPIIPMPAEYQLLKGTGFTLTPGTKIFIDKKAAGGQEAAAFLVGILGSPLATVEKVSSGTSIIRFLPLPKVAAKQSEKYSMEISRREIKIHADDPAGFHYAVQSLRQLLPATFYQTTPPQWTNVKIPALRITDHPRYAWRGLHLDVARNFHPVADIKRLLDLMAIHKLNRFHWHLTDDEGWRIAIRAYPELTNVGAFRGYGLPLSPTLGSGPERQGGFYTQAEIQDVVAYANQRHITIIPEIDMPGHARALLKSLPQLVDPDDRSVYESVQAYKDNVLSACLPATYEVVDRILQEVAALFPGPYLHVGGDEVPDGVWNPERSAQCKQTMAREGLKDKAQLQHFFFTKIKNSVEKYGKTMAGWEEIVSGSGFADRKVLAFAWKSTQEGERLAREGYPVILNPADHLYFDLAYSEDPREPGYYWAGTIDTKKVYSYPGPSSQLTAAQQKNVQGLQGNLWTETIRTRQDLDYRAFPRVVALAEIAWTPMKKQNWTDFSERLSRTHLPRLDAYGVQYRVAPGLSKLSSQP